MVDVLELADSQRPRRDALPSDIWTTIIRYLPPASDTLPSSETRSDLLALALTSKHLADLALPPLWRYPDDISTRIVHVINVSVPIGETEYLAFQEDTWVLLRPLPQSLREKIQWYLSYVQQIDIIPSSPQNTIWPIITLAIRARNLLSNVTHLTVGPPLRPEDHVILSAECVSIITQLSPPIKQTPYNGRWMQDFIPIHALIMGQISYEYPHQLHLGPNTELDQTNFAFLLGDTQRLVLYLFHTVFEKEDILKSLSLVPNLTALRIAIGPLENDVESGNIPSIDQKYCLPSLGVLEVIFYNAYTPVILEHLMCPKLGGLVLHTSNQIDFKLLLDATIGFPQLRSLNCISITELVRLDIENILSLKRLERLTLVGRSQLTAPHITDILSALPHLKCLVISGEGSKPLSPSILFTITRTPRQPFKFLSLPLDLTVDVSEMDTGFSIVQSCAIQNLYFTSQTHFPQTSAGKLNVACFLRKVFSTSTPLITPLFGEKGVSEPLTDIYDIMRLISRAKYGYVV